MINRLLHRYMGNSPYAITQQIPKFLSPLFSYVVFRKNMSIKFGSIYNELLFKLGVSIGSVLFTRLMKKAQIQKKLDLCSLFLAELETLGFGQSKIARFNLEANDFMVIQSSNPIGEQHRRSFGLERDFIKDCFFAGLLSGMIRVLCDGKTLYCLEEQSVAGGSTKTSYKLHTEFPLEKHSFDQVYFDELFSDGSLIFGKSVDEPNILIQKVIKLDQLKLDNGHVSVWGVLCSFFPTNMYWVCYTLLKQQNFDFFNELFYHGGIQSKAAIEFQVQKLGLERGIATFTSLLHQLEFFGYGKGTIVTQNDDQLVIRFTQNYAASQYHQLFKEGALKDPYFEGILSGMAEYSFGSCVTNISVQFNEDTVEYDLKLSKDKALCLTEKARSALAEEIVEVIEEKMKAKYYI